MLNQRLSIVSLAILTGLLLPFEGMAGGSDGDGSKKRLLEEEDSAPKRVRTSGKRDASSAGESTQEVNLEDFFQQARRYETGHGLPRDYGKAAEFYAMAADRGHRPSQLRLGILYDQVILPRNYEKAAYYYKMAADQGSKKAQYYLAVMYQEGVGVEKNLDLAQQYAQGGAAAGDPDFQHVLGQIFEEKGFYAYALNEYKKAAHAGNADAQYALAEMYRLSKGCVQMLELAVDLYQRAAKQNHEGAKLQLARAYLMGWGCTPNPWQVLKWGLSLQRNLDEDITDFIREILRFDENTPRKGDASDKDIHTRQTLSNLELSLENGIRIHNYYGVSDNFHPEQRDVVMAYRKLGRFEDAAIRLLKVLREVEPGFFVDVVKLPADWQRDFEAQEDVDFLTIAHDNQRNFLVWGEKNTRALGHILEIVIGSEKGGFFMEGFHFKSRISEVREGLKAIEKAYEDLCVLPEGSTNGVLIQAFPHLEVYGDIDQDANPLETLGQDIQQTQKNLDQFEKVYKLYIGTEGLGFRNEEFLNEYPFWQDER